MSVPRPLTRAIVLISLLGIALSVAGFARFDFGSAELLIFTPALALYAIVGGVVLERQTRNLVGALLLAFGAIGSVMFPLSALGSAPAGTPGSDVTGAIVQALDPVTYLILSLLLLVFPDGHLPSARWRPVVLIAIGAFVLGVAGNLFSDGALMVFPQHENPFGVGGYLALVAGVVGYVLSGIVMIAAAASLVVRWRRSDLRVRAQLKWIALSGAMLALAMAVYVASFFAWGVALVPLVAATVASALFPIAVGIAVLRYRLYEIDRLISRTIGWALVTGLLVAVFAGAVVALQAALAGVTQGQTLAVAASTLVAFALFQPLRRRVQRSVDRRFDRARYDGERIVASFAERLRAEVDLGEVVDGMRATVVATVRPASAGVWLRSGAAE